MSHWQSNFFRGVALDVWRLAMTPEITATEVQFLERALAIAPGARLLDVPCGNGRHAIELSKRGCRVTGVDLAAEYIDEARLAPIDAEWILGDMCDLPWSNVFDGAYCMGNSFGFLDRDAAPTFLQAIARCLKPGGRFALATSTCAANSNKWEPLLTSGCHAELARGHGLYEASSFSARRKKEFRELDL